MAIVAASARSATAGGTAVLDGRVTTSARRSPAVPTLIAGAWVTLLLAEATGAAALLHHHALIEGGPPLWLAVPLFLVGWIVMVAAMMLPASLPTIRVFEATSVGSVAGRWPRTTFLAGFALVWLGFGLTAFIGDVGLHHLVDATPWLAARPWLIEAGILATAGAWQFAPLKQRSLAACRHPAGIAMTPPTIGRPRALSGLAHGLVCLGSSWALMLLMFGEGFGSLPWMLGLTAVMTYEAVGRDGPRVAPIVGVGLVLMAVFMLSGGAPI